MPVFRSRVKDCDVGRAKLVQRTGWEPKDAIASIMAVRNGASMIRSRLTLASLRVFTEGTDQIKYSTAQLRIGNAQERSVEFYAFAAAEKFRKMVFPAGFGEPRSCFTVFRPRTLPRQVLEEELHTDTEDPGQLEKPAGADSICALLVFLNLLERQAEMLAKFFLAHAKQHAPEPNPSPYVNVDRVWLTRVRCIEINRRQRRLLH
jgi:hypothetical protein